MKFHSIAYDTTADIVVLFGGYNGTYLDDTWIYDLTMNIWNQKNQSTLPNARHSFSMNYITSLDKVILFGGYNGAYYDDIWLYPGHTSPLIGTFESGLTYFRVVLRIAGNFTWYSAGQPVGTELRFQVGLSNTTNAEGFHYISYYSSNFTFSGVALYLKYRAVFKSDPNIYFTPKVKKINIYSSFESPLERTTVTITVTVETTVDRTVEIIHPSISETTETETAASPFPGVLSVLVVLCTFVLIFPRRKSSK
ncbi:MAG: kelch repeat-containing protein [Promethearchaeota archaeon]